MRTVVQQVDSLVDGLDILCLEWRSTNTQSIKYDAYRPCIHLKAMTIRSIEKHLRSNVIRSSTDRLLPLARILYQCSEAKIANFDVHLMVEKEVAKLEVTVDDLIGMHVMARSEELNHEVSRLGFRKATSPSKHVHKRTSLAELEDHVDILRIFEAFAKINNIGMLKRPVNLDLCKKLKRRVSVISLKKKN